MELRHFRYFMAVAEEGNVTRAADRLGIQQPPLSRFIKDIESDLGVQLFIRRPRGVELTMAGQALYREAQSIIAGLERAIEIIRTTARGERGRICIGVTPTGPFVPFVPKVIREFHNAFPHVGLSIEEQLSGELIEHVHRGRIDVAFMWTPSTEGLVTSPLLHDPLVVVLPCDHPLAQAEDDAISVKALSAETFIVYGRKDGFGLYAATIVTCHAAGFIPNFGQESPRLASALSLVAAGLGIFFVPASIQCVDMNGVTYRALKAVNQPKSTLSLVSRRSDSSAVVRNFVSFVKQAAKRPPTSKI